MFVYSTFYQKSTIDDRNKSGRPHGVRTNSVVKTVRARIRRNALRNQKIMSREWI